ncbi:MAG: hypothetical protein K5653_09515 [Clostridiales bacterium]|nr:hypothetical protein [Clostridiales bacterium]
MHVKGYHGAEVGNFALILAIGGFVDIILVQSDSFQEDFKEIYGIFAYLIIFIIHIVIIYLLLYESKTLYINEDGIYVKWFGIIKVFCSWEDILFVITEKVSYLDFLRIEPYYHIICSIIPIKKNTDEWLGSEFQCVYYKWLIRHPLKVIAIRISDFKEGQLEEFWSYVPERLKK